MACITVKETKLVIGSSNCWPRASTAVRRPYTCITTTPTVHMGDDVYIEAIEDGHSRVFRVQSREGSEYRGVLCISNYIGQNPFLEKAFRI